MRMIREIMQSISDRYWQQISPVNFARRLGVKVGLDCRLIGVTRRTFGSEPYLVSLGNHVEVTAGVRFITHDGAVWVARQMHPQIDVIEPISVGNNVFIGLNTIILPGVSIGNNVVIAAGAIVTRDLADNAVYGGNPAKQICDITSYISRAAELDLGTKGLSPAHKKQYLLHKYKTKWP